MFEPINLYDDLGNLVEKGSSVVIQGVKCYLPPVGYVPDPWHKGKLIYTGVHHLSLEEDDFYWRRQGLPDNYQKLRRDEEAKQAGDPLYINMELEAFRESFEMMKKLEEELKGVNPELTIVKLVQALLKERR